MNLEDMLVVNMKDAKDELSEEHPDCKEEEENDPPDSACSYVTHNLGLVVCWCRWVLSFGSQLLTLGVLTGREERDILLAN